MSKRNPFPNESACRRCAPFHPGGGRWEYLALRIALDAGLTVPRFQLATFAGKHVLILERFDRKGSTRIPSISAMSMLELTYGEPGSYEYLAEAIQMAGSDPQKDQRELFGRMVLNILINNTDDHMRNHGFLRQGAGWRLSPLFDLEPTPPVEKTRFLNTAIHASSTTASIDIATRVARAVKG
ncbi:MAG: HipA domain-containing protein [Solidesulfovibrio sp.]|jgi:serine/threonine-protein kinase HipA|uniref:HipA domain-containing protein n=1 Tax=Solidesulfovibrio sp. TaxID=2910990 RepID=UPI002B21E329|nr:HipA domain-containing protein [Solidesulfovibrio sp.]MEA4856169.1 HipA domain-containing protein [Solidesulfovibrio sp.]